ncbi:MAG: hypothetical protein B6D59_00165 [Campylobacteraceae bacterium 4484_4]|nr:MAG: hypothetical protein B6D59_00165 [Campylobacteraceae bacterium 4484_4]
MISNIFDAIVDHSDAEILDTLFENRNVRIERIVSTGQHSPEGFWYDQEEDEFVLLLEGEAVLGFEEEELTLHPGDWLMIPARRRHRILSTASDRPTLWLTVFVKRDHG